MPRIARVVAEGCAYHITQRGNRREAIFLSREDHQTYLDLLHDYAARHELEILAYCLMSNHIHLVVIPGRADSMARVLKPVHMRYAQHFNRQLGQTGHVWQGRFYSCVLGDSHLRMATRYVERNPVRASLVSAAEDYEWSSARAHCACGASEHPKFGDMKGWRKWLAQEDSPADMELMRRNTSTGRPVGDPEFIRQLEDRLDRRLHALPSGRPRKEK